MGREWNRNKYFGCHYCMKYSFTKIGYWKWKQGIQLYFLGSFWLSLPHIPQSQNVLGP